MELMRKRLANGNDLVIVQVSGSGGSNYYSPAFFRLAEIKRDTAYTQINGRNVVSEISACEFNSCSTRGPRSRYAALLTEMVEEFNDTEPKTIDPYLLK